MCCVWRFGISFTYVIESIDSKFISVCLINDYSLIVDLHIFVYGHSEFASISLECSKVKLLILNNFAFDNPSKTWYSTRKCILSFQKHRSENSKKIHFLFKIQKQKFESCIVTNQKLVIWKNLFDQLCIPFAKFFIWGCKVL